MAIDLANADTYFTTHIQGIAWADFEDDLRTRAIAHAKRLLSERIDDFDDADTADGDMPRHDVAVYEQAFHMLKNSDLPRDGETGAPRYLEGADSLDEMEDINVICKSALRYITGVRPFPPVELSRG